MTGGSLQSYEAFKVHKALTMLGTDILFIQPNEFRNQACKFSEMQEEVNKALCVIFT